MASPFSIFRKYQKAFLAIAAVLAMIVFVFADLFLSWGTTSPADSGNQVVTSWKGGQITERELSILRQRRYFLNEVLQIIETLGRSRIEAEGGTNQEPKVRRFTFNPEAVDRNTIAAQVVQDRVMESLAKQEGMVVGPEVVNDYLRAISMGRVEDDEIVQIITRSGPYKSEASAKRALFDGLSGLLLGSNYMASLSMALDGTDPSLMWNDWLALNKKLKLQAAVLPAEKFLSEVEEPTDAQLVEFYETNKNQFAGARVSRGGLNFPSPNPGFRKPRKVKLKFLLGDVSAWTEKLLDEISEEEIVDYYERNKRSQFPKYDSIFDDETSGGLDDIFKEDAAATEESSDASSGESAEDTGEEAPAEDQSNTDDSAADEQPADEQPADNPPQDEPAAESPAYEEPAEAAAEPEAEESSRIAKPSPFRLVATENESDPESDDSQSEPSDTEPQESESNTEADVAASAESQESSEQASAEDDADLYEPLDSVREQIRRTLARDKAVQELAKVMDGAFNELTSAYNEYGGKLITAQADETDPPPVPTELSDLSSIAEAKGLYFEETIELSFADLAETAVGRSQDLQSRNAIARLAFQGMNLHQPVHSVDIDGYRYLVLKVEDIPDEIPTLEEAREEVIEAWKVAESKRIALEKGEELAEQAQEEGASLLSAVGDQDFEIVSTDFFSRFSFGSTQADMQRGPRLSEVPPLQWIGDEFLVRVFSMGDDEVLALANFDRSETYVVRIDQKEMTSEELQRAFLQTARNSQAIGYMSYLRLQRMQKTLISQLFTAVELDSQRLQEYLQATGQ